MERPSCLTLLSLYVVFPAEAQTTYSTFFDAILLRFEAVVTHLFSFHHPSPTLKIFDI